MSVKITLLGTFYYEYEATRGKYNKWNNVIITNIRDILLQEFSENDIEKIEIVDKEYMNALKEIKLVVLQPLTMVSFDFISKIGTLLNDTGLGHIKKLKYVCC